MFNFVLLISNGQSLRDKLWDFASDCHRNILEGYELSYDSLPTDLSQYCRTCIDDANNGYLFIEGSWPTCGCSCHINVGAYKGNSGDYTLMKYEVWPCSNNFGIYSSENLDDVMPDEFDLTTFNEKAVFDSVSYFHLEMNIPRIGTDTKVSIRLFPIGQIGKGAKGISFNTDNSTVIFNPYHLIDILDELSDDSQLELILNSRIDELPETIKKEVESKIGESRPYKSIQELQYQLQHTFNAYQQYSSLKYTQMLFSWNREKHRLTKQKLF